MRGGSRLPTLVATVLLLAARLGAADVSVVVRPSKTEVTVGEPFVVEVTAEGDDDATWTFPEKPGDEKLELELEVPAGGAARGSTAAGAGGGPDSAPAAPLPPNRRRYRAAAYAVDEAEIPAIALTWLHSDGTTGEVKSEPVKIRIVSVLPKDPEKQKLADVRPPEALSIGREFWIALVAALLIVGGAVWLLVRRLRRKREPEAVAPTPEIAPAEEALRALDALERGELLLRGELRGFYIELATVAKRYLERKLAAPVLEMTSSETVGFLRDNPYGWDVATAVREIVGAADAVKFAKGVAPAEEARRHLTAARGLVATIEERTRPRPEAPLAGRPEAPK